MKIIKVDKNNQVNGDGLRCVIWVSGCSHNCKGCHNPETHDYNFGHDITSEEKELIL
jgi:anaerobic ribonucleoside-triphosphate reductase activating protein